MLRFTAPAGFEACVDLLSRPDALSAGVFLTVVELLLFGLRIVLALLREVLLDELPRFTLLLLLDEELPLFCCTLEERVAPVVLLLVDELRVALVLLLLEEELRVAVVLFFCWELEDDARLADVLLEDEDEERVADVLLEEEDELLDAELELFEDDDELRVAEVVLELPPPRVCAAAGTPQTSAPARRAASESLNSFIILLVLLSPGLVNRLSDIG